MFVNGGGDAAAAAHGQARSSNASGDLGLVILRGSRAVLRRPSPVHKSAGPRLAGGKTEVS
jgi:hypothetical protein